MTHTHTKKGFFISNNRKDDRTSIINCKVSSFNMDLGSLDGFQSRISGGQIVAKIALEEARAKLIAKGYVELSRSEYRALAA